MGHGTRKKSFYLYKFVIVSFGGKSAAPKLLVRLQRLNNFNVGILIKHIPRNLPTLTFIVCMRSDQSLLPNISNESKKCNLMNLRTFVSFYL